MNRIIVAAVVCFVVAAQPLYAKQSGEWEYVEGAFDAVTQIITAPCELVGACLGLLESSVSSVWSGAAWELPPPKVEKSAPAKQIKKAALPESAQYPSLRVTSTSAVPVPASAPIKKVAPQSSETKEPRPVKVIIRDYSPIPKEEPARPKEQVPAPAAETPPPAPAPRTVIEPGPKPVPSGAPAKEEPVRMMEQPKGPVSPKAPPAPATEPEAKTAPLSAPSLPARPEPAPKPAPAPVVEKPVAPKSPPPDRPEAKKPEPPPAAAQIVPKPVAPAPVPAQPKPQEVKKPEPPATPAPV